MSVKRKDDVPSSDLPTAKKGKGISIKYNELGTLCYAVKHIPDRTPKRWELISTLVSEVKDCKNESPSMILKEKDDAQVKVFGGTPSSCRDAVSILCSSYSEVLDFSESKCRDLLSTHFEKTAIKPIIMVPSIDRCCGELITIRNRPSFPLVYTTHGTSIAALFTGECRKGCGKKFNYSFYRSSSNKTFFFNHVGKEYFHITSQTVFSIDLLEDITNNISLSATSFQSRAEVYNENFRELDAKNLKSFSDFGRSRRDCEHPWKLTEKRVEDAWFVYTLVSYFADKEMLDCIDFNTTTSPSQRIDVDFLCGKAWDIITETTNPWIYHKCKMKGCTEGKFLTLCEGILICNEWE